MKRQSTRTGPPAQSGLESLQAAVVAALEAQAHPEWIERGRLWHKNPDYAEYGVSAPMLGEIVRCFKPSFKQLSIAQRVHFAEALLASALSEQAHVAIVLLGMSTERLLPEYLEHLDRWPDDFHGWGATDDFCINVLQPLLVGHPGLVLPLLAQWSRSPNRWKRRASGSFGSTSAIS
jgi:hypothetical protein